MRTGSWALRAAGRAALIGATAVLVAGCVPDPGTGPGTTTTTAAPTTTTTTTTTTTSTTVPPTTTTTSTTTTSTTTTSTTTTSTTVPPTTTTTSTTVPPTTTTTTAPPVAVTTSTPFAASCQGSALGQVSTSDLNSAITSVAPSFVAANSNYTITLTPDPMPIPSSGGGQTIQNLNTLRIRFPVPANSTFVSATVSGGSNIGSGAPTVTQASGIITLTVPGPLAAGTTATLPTVNLTLKATGAPGTSIKTVIAGSSYANPGITFNVRINLFGLTVATNCFVTTTPAPVFSNTPIS